MVGGTETDEDRVSGELPVVLEMGVVSGFGGTVEVCGISVTVEVSGLCGMVEVSAVEAGGGTQYVHTVDVLVMKTVEMVEVVSSEVLLPLVTVLVTGHVVRVVRMLLSVS